MIGRMNYDDVVSQLTSHGLLLDKPITTDARIQRWKVEGEDHERRGWSRLREWTSAKGNVYIVGNYGIWHGNDDGNVKVELPGRDDDKNQLSKEDIANMRAAQKEAQRRIDAERKAEIKVATGFAQRIWLKCTPCEEHEYLKRKQIKSHGLRQLDSLDDINLDGIDDSNRWRLQQALGALVVPMHDAEGEVCGLQFIYPWGHPRKQKIDRDKEFWPAGMAMGGSFGLISSINNNSLILLGEGYATMASLHEATGVSVCYAFSANNLIKAAKSLRKKYPRLRILFCADDDYLSEGNPGVSAAVSATAELENTDWIKPFFADADGNDRRGGKKLTDFNDLYIIAGNHLTLANQINDKLTELKWRALPVDGGGVGQSGGGDSGGPLSMLYPNEVVARFSPVWSPDDVFYFDHHAHVMVSKASITNRMRRHGWDMVQAHADWQDKPEVRIEEVDFDPAKTDPAVKYNLWHGLPELGAVPNASCDALLDLLYRLCSHEHQNAMEIFNWVLDFLAYPLQNPGAKMQSCILIHGAQGAGKNTFFGTILEIYGNEYSVEFGPAQLENRFNAVFSKKLFAIGNEVVASREDLYHVKGNIKHMVTERRWVVEGKHKDQRWERNCCNFVFMSNELNPQVLDSGDRRHLVIWTPPVPDPQKDQERFKVWQQSWDAAQEERRNGGVYALYQTLMQRDLSHFSEASWPPMTQAKQDLIDLNMDSRERFFREWMNGAIEGVPCMPCITEDIYEVYRAWITRSGIARHSPMHTFSAYVGKQPSVTKSQERVLIGQTYFKKMMIIPSSAAPPPDRTKSSWLAECADEFREHMSNYKGGKA